MSYELPSGLRPGGRFDAWAPALPAYLVADVDGTLVGPSATATDAVVAAAGRARDAGLAVGFATGRMRLAVEPLYGQLGVPGPHVLHNGAEVRAGGRSIATWPLSPAALATVFRIARELDAYAEIYTPDGYAVTALDERARPHWELLGHEPFAVVTTPDELGDVPVLKATFGLFDGESPATVVAALDDAAVRAGPAGSPLTPTITYVNATDPAVDKGRAVTAAAAHLGVDLAATVAVGDAPNDLPMLAVVGTAIAMGQAEPEVKAAAHLVVPEVDADGVAHAIDACLGWRRATA
ncbi:MAG: Cof-type HAD-IIB family hydrolase [Actinobacteria bacterium]|nr:Cof-type HAD-IIB family hydrolase [Actinomycetota bacterium]